MPAIKNTAERSEKTTLIVWPMSPIPRQWRILQTVWGDGRDFLLAWHHWKQSVQRPALLHYVAIIESPALRLTRPPRWFGFNEIDESTHGGVGGGIPHLNSRENSHESMFQELSAQWWGLTPGMHRLSFEAGHVLLTLCVGELGAMLRELVMVADVILLPEQCTSDLHTVKAIARLCQRGTALVWDRQSGSSQDEAYQPHLSSCGFIAKDRQWVYAPQWRLRREPARLNPGRSSTDIPQTTATLPSKRPSALVIGAGLSGAAVAASLAKRGSQVLVLSSEAAQAASTLPAGLFTPLVSSDDNLSSRLVRSGLRVTLHQAHQLLAQGSDWALTGCTQRHLKKETVTQLPELGEHGDAWSSQSSQAPGTNESHSPIQHHQAGWIKPAQLVAAWLAQPGIELRRLGVSSSVHHLERTPASQNQWQALDANGQCLASADIVIVACGAHSADLLQRSALPCPELQTLRGQVTWASLPRTSPTETTPCNGYGHWIPHLPLQDTSCSDEAQTARMSQEGHWQGLTGATFQRDDLETQARPEDDIANIERLSRLDPTSGQAMQVLLAQGQTQSWAGLRCVNTGRLPLACEIAPQLHLITAMGSRGLSFAALCAESLVAEFHQEPHPLPKSLLKLLRPRTKARSTVA